MNSSSARENFERMELHHPMRGGAEALENGSGMTDNNDDKTLHVTGKKTLTLKPSGLSTQGTVRQDMGRGRSKAVVVETRKRRPGGHDEKPQVVVPIQAPTPLWPAGALADVYGNAGAASVSFKTVWPV